MNIRKVCIFSGEIFFHRTLLLAVKHFLSPLQCFLSPHSTYSNSPQILHLLAIFSGDTSTRVIENRALNTVPCNFAEATFIICQFNKHCGSLQNYADIHDYEEKVQDEKEYENEDENEDKNEDEKGVKEGEGGEESDSYFQLNVAIPPIKANLKIGKGDKTQKQTNLLDNMKTAIQARHPSQIARH